MILLLYRRLLWRTGYIDKNTPLTLYHLLILGEHEMTF